MSIKNAEYDTGFKLADNVVKILLFKVLTLLWGKIFFVVLIKVR
jgi:hypothetical protein